MPTAHQGALLTLPYNLCTPTEELTDHFLPQVGCDIDAVDKTERSARDLCKAAGKQLPAPCTVRPGLSGAFGRGGNDFICLPS